MGSNALWHSGFIQDSPPTSLFSIPRDVGEDCDHDASDGGPDGDDRIFARVSSRDVPMFGGKGVAHAGGVCVEQVILPTVRFMREGG